MTNKELQEILKKHKDWVYGNSGEQADLRGADLTGANLTGADLRGADLRGAKYKTLCVGYNLSCPEVGAFMGFKKLRDDKIATLLIPEEAKRSSATTRKCRCDKALVLEIKKDNKAYKTGYSQHDSNFKYVVGKEVNVDNFDEDRWNECSTGIHFFITKEEAEEY